ncbi:MAG: DUF86 domain-containing protein [Nitrospirae bacterium]|nr:DUF86 domain-containing protein [Nitrospirota bacterium]
MEEIKAKISVIQERVRRLSKFKKISFETYLKDITVKDAIERNIEVAIQACIDIAKIIIKKEGLREPEDNKGVFVVLSENNIISESSLRFLIPMAGTRNILVHGYEKIDDAIIFGVLKKHLSDFNTFLKEIEERYPKEIKRKKRKP